MQPPLLPLFPLGVVLFPRTPLPLHIFEDRYKELIGEAIANQTEFGIVLAGEKGVMNTGCTAIVEKVVHRYPDGRMDILTVGRRRFELLLVNDEKSYYQGSVEFFDDEPEESSPELREQVLKLFAEVQSLDLAEDVEVDLDDLQLSFQIAQVLPDLSARQILLQTRSENERLAQLISMLPDHISKQRAIAKAKALAPKNGHLPGSANRA
jgi:Lon protease-like protein